MSPEEATVRREINDMLSRCVALEIDLLRLAAVDPERGRRQTYLRGWSNLLKVSDALERLVPEDIPF
jgi:hypothetical protein